MAPSDPHARCRAACRRVRLAADALGRRPPNPLAELAPLVLGAGVYGSVLAASCSGGGAHLLAVLTGAWCLTALGVIAHDCVHGALSRRGGYNDWVGRWVLAQNFASFAAYRAIHLAHHRHTGFDEDPSGDSPKVQKRTNLLVHVLLLTVPFGFPLFQIVPGWAAAFGTDPVTYPPRVQAGIRRDLPWVVALHLGLWFGLGPAAYGAYVEVWLASMLMVIQLFGFNHVGTEFYTDCVLCNTRNIHARPAPLEALTLYAGYHVEHHLIPRVPWYRLPELHRLLAAEGGARFSEDGYHVAQAKMFVGYWRQLWGTGSVHPGEPAENLAPGASHPAENP